MDLPAVLGEAAELAEKTFPEAFNGMAFPDLSESAGDALGVKFRVQEAQLRCKTARTEVCIVGAGKMSRRRLCCADRRIQCLRGWERDSGYNPCIHSIYPLYKPYLYSPYIIPIQHLYTLYKPYIDATYTPLRVQGPK